MPFMVRAFITWFIFGTTYFHMGLFTNVMITDKIQRINKHVQECGLYYICKVTQDKQNCLQIPSTHKTSAMLDCWYMPIETAKSITYELKSQ